MGEVGVGVESQLDEGCVERREGAIGSLRALAEERARQCWWSRGAVDVGVQTGS